MTDNTFFYRSPLGTIHVREQNGALVSAVFVEDASETAPSSHVLCEAKAWLDRYFAGYDPGPVPPLLPSGTPFQRAVWTALSSVSYGETVSYGALAKRMGRTSRYARAVGAALHANPLPLFIPCHRVIGKNGSLTGFAGGIEMKQKLLETERI